MTTLALQMIWDNDNGNPADKVMNTWHFKTNDAGDPGTDASDCEAKLVTFYDGIRQYLSSFLTGAYTCRAFDLSEPQPRVPVLEHVGALLGVGASSGLPCEVAVCLSFEASHVSGEPQARRRGRVYIGPLAVGSDAILPDGAAGDMIVGADFRAALALKAAALAGVFAGSDPGSQIAWCTFSPTDVADGRTVSEASHNVIGGWIDYAVDTQRRRGHAPGGRTLWVD